MKMSCLVAALLLAAGPVVAGGLPEAVDCDNPATVALEDCPAPIVVGSNASSLMAGSLGGGGAAVAAVAALAVLLIAGTSGTSGTD